MSKPRVLITGSTGFVGLRLHRDLAKDFEVIATHRGHSPQTEGVDWVRFDAEADSPIDLLDRTRPDCVIHLLALSRTEVCAKAPETAERINTGLTAELGKLSSERGIRFLFTSTDQVFDGTKGSYRETDEPRANGVYARTKIEAEGSLDSAFRDLPDLLTVFRLALSYGHSDERHPGPVGWIVNALKKGEEVHLFADEIRSPLYVGDISRAMKDAIENRRSGLFHLGGPDSIDRHSFGLQIAEKLGLPSKLCLARSVKDYPGPEPRSPNCSFDISKFVSTFGWSPCGIEEGLERTLSENEN